MVMVKEEEREKEKRVKIGATVTIEVQGAEETYTITEEQSDPNKGRISYNTPLARALMGAKVGEERRVTSPGGVYIVRIVRVRVKKIKKNGNK